MIWSYPKLTWETPAEVAAEKRAVNAEDLELGTDIVLVAWRSHGRFPIETRRLPSFYWKSSIKNSLVFEAYICFVSLVFESVVQSHLSSWCIHATKLANRVVAKSCICRFNPIESHNLVWSNLIPCNLNYSTSTSTRFYSFAKFLHSIPFYIMFYSVLFRSM